MAADPVASTVLIAVDLSHYSEEAFSWYMERMHQPQNAIVLVHCIEMPSVPSRDTWEQQVKLGKEKSQELQDLYGQKLQDKGASAKFIFDFEKPGEFITKLSKSEGANMVVMGTRGMSKIRRTFIGSVSSYVLNHAECPVLICRTPKD